MGAFKTAMLEFQEKIADRFKKAGMVVVEFRADLMLQAKNGRRVPLMSVEAAMIHLSLNCDHAHSVDGQGFSRVDSEFGNNMASIACRYGRFTDKQLARLQHSKAKGDARDGLIVKYRRQLRDAGFDMAVLLAQALEAPRAKAEQQPYEQSTTNGTVTGKIVKHTAKAYLFVQEGHEVWLPKSQIAFVQPDPGEDGVFWAQLRLPFWLIHEKNLIKDAVCGE